MSIYGSVSMLVMRCDMPYLDPVKHVSHPKAKWYQVKTSLLSDPRQGYDWERFAPMEIHLFNTRKTAVAHNAREFNEFLPMFSQRSNIPYSVAEKSERMTKPKARGAIRNGMTWKETFTKEETTQ